MKSACINMVRSQENTNHAGDFLAGESAT